MKKSSNIILDLFVPEFFFSPVRETLCRLFNLSIVCPNFSTSKDKKQHGEKDKKKIHKKRERNVMPSWWKRSFLCVTE